jgi:hypothetical protein
MSAWNWPLRLRSSLLAALAGWFAGVLVTFPIEASVAWRNSDGQAQLMTETLALGMVVWSTWTLAFSLLGWLVVAAPVTLILSPLWLRKYKTPMVVAVGLAAVALPAHTFGLFTIFSSTRLFDAHNFWVYSLFGASFVVVFVLTYLRLVGGLVGRRVWPRRD